MPRYTNAPARKRHATAGDRTAGGKKHKGRKDDDGETRAGGGVRAGCDIGEADGRCDRAGKKKTTCADQAALVRSQCGLGDPKFDPLRVCARSNTWCHLLQHKDVDLESLCRLRDSFPDGTVVFPWDVAYNTLRLNYNKRINQFPSAIVLASSARQVSAALCWAREHEVPVSVRSGGHSFEGYSLTEGLVVDVSRIDRVSVDSDTRTAAIGPGALIGPTYMALQEAGGWVVPGGTCPNVGLAGLTLGGGVGFLERKWGLTCDNLLAVDLVLADGRRVRADAEGPHKELFWACRGGGGGNFGVATRFTYTLHKARNVLLLDIALPWSAAGRAIAAWQRWAPHVDRSLTTELALKGPKRGVVITGEFAGDGGRARLASLLEPLRRALGRYGRRVPIVWSLDDEDDDGRDAKAKGSGEHKGTATTSAGRKGETVTETTWSVKRVAFLDAARHYADGNVRPPFQKVKSDIAYVPLTDQGIRALVEHAGRIADADASDGIYMQAFGGAMADVPRRATAWLHRAGALFWIEYATYWSEQNEAARKLAWITAAWEALRPYVSGFAYVNFPDLQLPDWLWAFWGPHLPRLSAVKRRYDPTGFFSMPQGIPLVPPPGWDRAACTPQARAAAAAARSAERKRHGKEAKGDDDDGDDGKTQTDRDGRDRRVQSGSSDGNDSS